jgi:hypothetical protein
MVSEDSVYPCWAQCSWAEYDDSMSM